MADVASSSAQAVCPPVNIGNEESDAKLRFSRQRVLQMVALLNDKSYVDTVTCKENEHVVTMPQLLAEVEGMLNERAGRVSLDVLQNTLGVPQKAIQDATSTLTAMQPTTRIVNRELITRAYAKSMLLAINTLLHANGCLTLKDLYEEYSLPLVYIQKMIEDDNGANVECILDITHGWSFMHTAQYTEQIAYRIKDALKDLTKPTQLKLVFKQVDTIPAIFQSTLRQLVTSAAVEGSVKGPYDSSGMYIPTAFRDYQRSWTSEFFGQNGYLDFREMKAMLMDDPATHTAALPGHVLGHVFVGLGILAKVDCACDEALSTQGFYDLMRHVPPSFTENDVVAMATHLDSYETAKVDLVGGHFLVVKNIAERFVELFDDTLSARVKEVRQRGGVKHRETSSNRKSARAGRLKGNHHVLTMHEIGLVLRSNLDNNRRPDAVVVHMCTAIAPLLDIAFERKAECWDTGDAQEDQKDSQRIYKRIQLLQMYVDGVRRVQGDTTPFNVHLLSTLGYTLLQMRQAMVVRRYWLKSSDSDWLSSGAVPSDVKERYVTMRECLEREDVEAFLSVCADVIECDLSGVSVESEDRTQITDELMEEERHTNHTTLASATVPAAILHLVVFLVFQRVTGCILSAPGRCVPQLITTLKSLVPSDHYKKLVRYQKFILKLATAQKAGDVEAIQIAEDELAQRTDEVYQIGIDG